MDLLMEVVLAPDNQIEFVVTGMTGGAARYLMTRDVALRTRNALNALLAAQAANSTDL